MAYELNPLQNEDEENKNQIQGQGGGALIAGAGENGLAAGSANTTSGQQHTNVNDYLDANRTQADTLAGKIAGNIRTQGDQVRGQITQAGENFNQGADAKTVRLDQGLVDQARSNPTEFVKDQGNVQRFGTMRDASYGGPRDLTDYGYSDLQRGAQNAVQKGSLVDTDAGREQLLAEVSRHPSAGGNSLNNLLLSGQPTALKTLQDAKTGVSDLSSYLDQVNSQAQERAKQAGATTDATRQAIQNQFKGEGGAIPSLYGEVDARTGQLQKEAAENNRAKDLLTQGNVAGLSDAQLQALGASRGELNSFEEKLSRLKELGKNFDVSGYLKTQAPEAQITRNNAATSDEAARLSALESLFGGESQIPMGQPPASSDLVDFDKSAYTDLSSMLRKAEMDKASQDLGGWYYNTIGQHTGEGFAPARAGRETPDLIHGLLNDGRGLNQNELNQYFYNYVKPPAAMGDGPWGRSWMDQQVKAFNDQIQAARDRLGQAKVNVPANPNIVLK
jgi:hypothetical protein